MEVLLRDLPDGIGAAVDAHGAHHEQGQDRSGNEQEEHLGQEGLAKIADPADQGVKFHQYAPPSGTHLPLNDQRCDIRGCGKGRVRTTLCVKTQQRDNIMS